MRRIYVEVPTSTPERFANVQQKEDGYYVETWVLDATHAGEVGPLKTVGRALKAALMWCETGKVLYVTQ